MNPIFGRFRQNQMPQGGLLGNMSALIGQINQFGQNFQGNPQAKVQELLQSGQMTQEQFQQLSNMANQIQQFMGNRK